MLVQIPRLASILMAQCQFVPDRCVPERKFHDDTSPGLRFPWTMRPFTVKNGKRFPGKTANLFYSVGHNLGINLIQFESPTGSFSVDVQRL
jgi:hypothetical protein